MAMADERAIPDSGLRRPEEWLAAVRRDERQGELFRAYDLARQGLDQFPDDLALKHRAVLCLASCGATRKAAEELVRLGLDRMPDLSLATPLGLDIAALRPRLLKDNALAAAEPERATAFSAAAQAYERVYREAKRAGSKEAYYPGVNGASMNLLAGNGEAACGLAREVLEQLAELGASDRTFYEVASELEAQIVLGDLESAGKTISTVKARARSSALSDYRGLSSMLRQLRLVIEAKGLGAEWLDALAPPRVIHFLGHIVAPPGQPGRFPAAQEPQVKQAIADILGQRDVGFGYGSLAAGADILFAEALLDHGASLHIVLPFDREEFVDVSVRPAGDHWVDRFERCLKAAEASGTVRYATDDRYLGDDHLFGYCSQLAMGLALLRARHLSTAVEQVAVWDGVLPAGPVGTAADVSLWRRTGMPQTLIPVGNGFQPANHPPGQARGVERRIRAMLFGDIHGFSKLTDGQLPDFIEHVLATSAQAVRPYRESGDILLANTWGDGLFLVFADAGRAADCALALQEALGRIDMAANGLPDDMGLRIGLHLGPTYAAQDPILERDNFFGAHVSRAARIEPVTPEGCIYVTETMAAVLALNCPDTLACEYVGNTAAAKHYGQMRMFLLGRAASRL
ncbi:MAG TPA: adenylate/guanylate cyclase domain-containing protein [Stellaceae bacterium]|nr:adenylate/guanylate cyclase domain-containing protein [Stellaceae bacterium]